MSIQEVRLFIVRFVSGEITPAERGAFLKWMEGASVDDLRDVADQFEALEDKWSFGEGPNSVWMEQLEGKLDSSDAGARMAPIKRMRPQRSIRRAVGVAAAVVLVALSGAGVYQWYSGASGRVPQSPQKPADVFTDIASVRRGEPQKSLMLADGSKVWLNSASTLKYSRSFTGGERTVELSGEAYFEVAKNASMPFRVKVRDVEIEVLGTNFNVTAYSDEHIGRTSLMEGSVKIVRGAEKVLLGPGDQAEINYSLSGNSMRVTQGMDQERILAWKNGYLDFKDDDLQTVMNQISRSYDLNVIYADKDHIPVAHFSGKFPWKNGIHEIIKTLEFQHIHCRIEGKIIKVVP